MYAREIFKPLALYISPTTVEAAPAEIQNIEQMIMMISKKLKQ